MTPLRRARLASMQGRLVSLLLTLSAPSLAQTPQTDALVEAGLRLRDRGDLEGAAAVFRQAWEQGRSPRAEALLAITEQGMGRWSAADGHLREALDTTTHPWIRQNRARLEQALAVIDARLGSLQVRGGVPGAEVMFNGEPLATLPMAEPARVDVGSGVIEVRAEGYHPWNRPVSIAPGALSVETAVLAPITATSNAPQAPTPQPPTSDGAIQRTLGWVALGLGGAGLALGVTWTGIREIRVSDYRASACGRPEIDAADEAGCTQSRTDANDAPVRWMMAGYAMAGVFAVTSLVLHLTAPARSGAAQGAAWACGVGRAGRSVECAIIF